MSESMDKAFEAAMIEAIGGTTPMQKMQKVTIAKFCRTERRAVQSELKDEKLSWQAEQKSMKDAGLDAKSTEWIDAKELHDLNVSTLKLELEDLRKMIG